MHVDMGAPLILRALRPGRGREAHPIQTGSLALEARFPAVSAPTHSQVTIPRCQVVLFLSLVKDTPAS